jgi:hypothetical protein
MNIAALNNAVAAVCPIDGLAVGDPADKATWRIDFDPSATDQQRQAAQAALAAFDPATLTAPVPVRPTPRQWLERLSPQTQLGLETAALSNATVSLWLRKATGASDGIDVTLQETKDGVAAMVTAGLLTTDEQATLLAP